MSREILIYNINISEEFAVGGVANPIFYEKQILVDSNVYLYNIRFFRSVSITCRSISAIKSCKKLQT